MMVFAVCHSVGRNEFINYDDDQYIVNNPHIKTGLNFSTVRWAFTTYDLANWHPLTWLSHSIDYQMFGLKPAGPHLVNVLFHAANAVLLFLLLEFATGLRWRAFAVAAIFALHPINVESVAWAAERKNVLSMFCFLLALLAYEFYSRRPAAWRYLLVFVSFALALMSKPQVITFPFLLLLWDFWPMQRLALRQNQSAATQGDRRQYSISWLLLEKSPLLLLSVLSAYVTMKAQSAGQAIQSFSLYSVPLRIETAIVSYVTYMRQAVWPVNLAAMYPHPTHLFPYWVVIASALLLILTTSLAIYLRSSAPYLVVGWLWFLGSMIPMLGLVQVGAQGMADRYAYQPFIGLFIMMVWGACDWCRARKLSTAWLALPAAACLISFGALTLRQVSYWHDTATFWQHTLAVTKDNYVAHDELGEYLAGEGRIEDAAQQFRDALAIRADDLPAQLNLGTYEHGKGNLVGAIARYQAVALRSTNVTVLSTAYGNMGSAYRQRGELGQAETCYEAALKLDHNMASAMIGLGLIAEKREDYKEAIHQYNRAMTVQPTDVGFLLLAGALQHAGRAADGKIINERVNRLSPNLTAARALVDSLHSGK